MADGSRAEWTFLLYVGSVKNGLDYTREKLLASLSGFAGNPPVYFVYQIATEDGTERGLIGLEDLHVEVLAMEPPIDASKKKSLRSFVDWATESYPSRYTALVLKDHGGGLDPPQKRTARRDWLVPTSAKFVAFEILEDGESNDYLTNRGLRTALEETRRGRVDVFAFDACLMNLVEVLYEVREVAAYLVATANPLSFKVFPYRKAIEALAADRRTGPRELARVLAEGSHDAQLVATELAWMKEVASSFDELGAALFKALKAGAATKLDAIRAVLAAGDAVDAKQLFGELMRAFDKTDVGRCAGRADETLAQACFARGPQSTANGVPLGGTSVFFPQKRGSQAWAKYGELKFTRGNRWTEFLAEYCWPIPPPHG